MPKPQGGVEEQPALHPRPAAGHLPAPAHHPVPIRGQNGDSWGKRVFSCGRRQLDQQDEADHEPF